MAAALVFLQWHRPAPPAVLRVGFAELSPYIEINENGLPTGLAVQVIERAAARAGVGLLWIPVEESESALRSGAIDLYPIFTVTPERTREFHLSAPWWESSQALVSLRDHPLKSAADTSGKRIGVRSLTAATKLATEALPGAFLVRFRLVRGLLTRVCTGEIDGAISEGRLIYSALLNVPEGCNNHRFTITPVPTAVNVMASVSSQAAAPTADRVFDAIQDLVMDGVVSEIANRWFAIPQQRFALQRLVERQRIYLAILYIAGGLLFVLSLRFAWRSQQMRQAYEKAREVAGEAERRFEVFMSHTPATSMIRDGNGRFVYVNRAFTDVYGLTPEQAAGIADTDLWSEEVAAQMRVGDLQVLRHGTPVQYLLPIPERNGSMRHWLVLKFRLSGESGPCIGITAIDVSEQQRAADLVSQSEERYRMLFDQAPLAMHEIDQHGVIRRVNRTECDLFGLEPEELLGRYVWDLVAGGEREAARATVTAKLAGIQPLTPFEGVYEHEDGRILHFEVHETPIPGEGGLIRGIRSCLVDLSESYEARKRLDQYAEELKEKNAALALALEAAEEATRLKSQFLANMSHEIRTPMNAVLGMTEMLLASGLNPVQRSLAQAVSHSGGHLLGIINDILDFSKIEADRLELERVELDLRELVEGAAGLMAPGAHTKGVAMICHMEPDTPAQIWGDPARLRQVLLNLLSNAVKFTPKGHIALLVSGRSTGSDRATLRFAVSDTGVGIPADAIPRLFTAFTQADSSTTRRFGGTGLGLAIAQRIVQQMGGKMGVDSRPGKGSTFWFHLDLETVPEIDSPQRGLALRGHRILIADGNHLSRQTSIRTLEFWGMRATPVENAAEALQGLRDAAEEGDPYVLVLIDAAISDMDGGKFCREIDADARIAGVRIALLTLLGIDRGKGCEIATISKPVRMGELLACLEALIQGVDSKPILRLTASTPESCGNLGRILIAEDNPLNQRVANLQVKKLGFETDVVCDGKEALEALQSRPYTLVLMDCQMPGMDGWEATRELRRREGSARHTPVIAMTANAFTTDREACMQAGMDDFLAKPVNLRELSSVLERWSGAGVLQ